MTGRVKQPSSKAMDKALEIMRARRIPVSENTEAYLAYENGYEAATADIVAWLRLEPSTLLERHYARAIERGVAKGAAGKRKP